MANRERSLATIAEALVAATLGTMNAWPEESRAAFVMAFEPEGARLLRDMAKRVATAVTALLASAGDASFADVADIGFAVTGALAGAARALVEHGVEASALAAQHRQLVLMMRGYLELAAREGGTVSSGS